MINQMCKNIKVPADDFHSGIVASQSFHRHTFRQLFRCLLTLLFLVAAFSKINAQEIIIKFHPTANNKPLVMSDSSYINSAGEIYQLTRLKYYISNIGFSKNDQQNVSLIDASSPDSIMLHLKPGKYSNLYFTLGVDSALNCSGAQDGALDPLNGMFWTWNSGYIFFKMEGYSTSSKADLNRIEHHVGGYRTPYRVSRQIDLKLPVNLVIKPGDIKVIDINVNIDNYWKGLNEIKIADQALLMAPGPLAVKVADNFQQMFSITRIQ